MKTPTRNSKNHVLKTVCSLFMLLAMISGVLAQETAPDTRPDILNLENINKINSTPDKSTPIMLNVIGGGARIHDLTVGRGGGNNLLNTAFGNNALHFNTSGHRNTAIGSYALTDNTTGTLNTAIGRFTLRRNTSGSWNTALGSGVLEFNSTGANNTAVGAAAMALNTTGYSNVAMGVRALYRNTVQSNLVAVGDSALYNNGLNVTTSYDATANTALGSKALYSNTTGSYNTATGFRALNSNTTGSCNTALGNEALINNTTGNYNTAMGNEALINNTTGNYNTVYGTFALYELTGGSENVAIGDNAGALSASISRGTFVGSEAKPNGTGFSNITGIGYNARPTASNQVRIGNASVTSIGGNAGWTNFSDGGYKNNVEEDVAGLDFILKLRPVSYDLDAHRLASGLGEDQTRDEDGSKATAVLDEITQKSRDEKAAIRYTGFIAQEVEATVNDLGVAFSGVDAPVDKSGYYGLRYADFVVPLVKAVQEQQAQIEALSPEGIDALQSELVALRAENQLMRGQINEIISLLENLGVDVSQSTRHGAADSQQQYPSGNARLEQNTPNPFHENTVIRYFLPEGTYRAQIIVTDMGGTQVMSLPLEHQGAGQVLIHGGSLTTGTYVYTLVVDGRKVESKRMILL